MSSIIFKGTSLSVVTTVIKTADLTALRESLSEKLERHPAFFNHEPTVLDFGQFSYDKMIPWLEIFALLKSFHLVPIACQNVPEHLIETLRSYLPALDQSGFDLKQLSVLERDVAPEATGALVIDRPLRSGQKIYGESRDVIVLDVVSHGAEVISDYNIHVYAPLRGRALAGARGDTSARIFTTCFEAELIAIAGIYSTFEKGLPEKFRHKPVKIRLKREEAGNDMLMLEDLLF